MFDLVSMDRRDSRSKQKVTMLQRSQGWSDKVLGQIVNSLKIETSSLPKAPDKLLIYGEFSKERLFGIIGTDDFTLEVIEGLDNERLPWKGW